MSNGPELCKGEPFAFRSFSHFECSSCLGVAHITRGRRRHCSAEIRSVRSVGRGIPVVAAEFGGGEHDSGRGRPRKIRTIGFRASRGGCSRKTEHLFGG